MTHPTIFQTFNPSKLLRSVWFYPLLSCFILLLLFSTRQITTFDIGFHLKGGQWICQHLCFPQKDTYTYTQSNRDYLDSNGLFQILIYLSYEVFGYPSLTLLNMAVITGVFLLLFLRIRAKSPPVWALVLLLLSAILMMERRFVVRPETFSWLYLNATLFILDLRQNRTRNLLFLLPVIQFFWVNTEGLFMMGWAATAIYALSTKLHEKRWDPLLLRYGFISMVADLLNPYGFNGLLFPFTLWGRLQPFGIYKENISEFNSPWSFLTSQNLRYDSHLHVFLFFLFAFLLLALLVWTLRKRKLYEWALCFFFLFLACQAVRNIPFFVIVVFPILASCVADLDPRIRWPRLETPWVAVVLSLSIFFLGLRVATNAYYADDRRNDRMGLGVAENILPVQATQFLRENDLNGRLINSLTLGGWLDWQAPQPTFIDGRLEVPTEDFFQQYLDSYQPGGLSGLAIRYSPDLILVDHNIGQSWVLQLKSNPDWRLIYLDPVAAIYAHKGYAPQWPALDLSTLLTREGITPQTSSQDSVRLDRTPQPLLAWFSGFWSPQTYRMDLSSLGLFDLTYGNYFVARELFLRALAGTTGEYEEMYFNLGVACLHLREIPLGRICLQDSLKLNSNNPAAQRMLQSFQP